MNSCFIHLFIFWTGGLGSFGPAKTTRRDDAQHISPEAQHTFAGDVANMDFMGVWGASPTSKQRTGLGRTLFGRNCFGRTFCWANFCLANFVWAICFSFLVYNRSTTTPLPPHPPSPPPHPHHTPPSVQFAKEEFAFTRHRKQMVKQNEQPNNYWTNLKMKSFPLAEVRFLHKRDQH